MKRCFNQRFEPYILETTITKAILKHKLYSGIQPAIELLYGRYAGMLYSFVLQFISDRKEAEDLLVNIFQKLTPQLQDACQSPLSVYSWMQMEARKIILEYFRTKQEGDPGPAGQTADLLIAEIRQFPSSYLSLLRRATEEQQWVFREAFLKGRQKEELALQLGKDSAYVEKVLRDSLVIIRSHMQ
jgi:DNA-directed RNA polymerase specialized sigma24 family protein